MEEKNQIKKDTVSVPAVETFTDDMVKVIEDSQGGMIKKIIAEQEKHEVEKINFSPESKRNKTFVFVSLLLILLAMVLLAFIFFRNRNIPVPVVDTTTHPNPLIYVNKVEMQAVEGLNAKQIAEQILLQASRQDVKSGEVEGIYLTENTRVIGLRKFGQLMNTTFVPGSPELIDDNFLMGVLYGDTKDFFILLRSRSFVDIFTPMQNWENKMFSELHMLFGEEINSLNSELLTKKYEDRIIENKNARILYDANGEIALMYVFVDEHHVLITKTRKTAHEVLARLTISLIKK